MSFYPEHDTIVSIPETRDIPVGRPLLVNGALTTACQVSNQ